jgi:hypothetical protein
MEHYEVIAGNVGVVYSGTDPVEAKRVYDEYNARAAQWAAAENAQNAQNVAGRDRDSRARRGRRHPHPAVRIRKTRRAATSKKIQRMIREGYSPSYAAKKAYHGRDPARRKDYPYEASRTGEYVLLRDGKEIMRGSEDAVWRYLHRSPYSVSHALKYEGYKIVPLHGERDPRVSAAKRRSLKPSQFALPERRALPLYDAERAANAASRLAQMHNRGTVTEREYRSALKRVRAAERRFGIHPNARQIERVDGRDPRRGKLSPRERAHTRRARDPQGYDKYWILYDAGGGREYYKRYWGPYDNAQQARRQRAEETGGDRAEEHHYPIVRMPPQAFRVMWGLPIRETVHTIHGNTVQPWMSRDARRRARLRRERY